MRKLKKLTLNKEVIANIGDNEMTGLKGGGISDMIISCQCTITCATLKPDECVFYSGEVPCPGLSQDECGGSIFNHYTLTQLNYDTCNTGCVV